MNVFHFLFKAVASKVGLLPQRHHLRVASDEALLLREAEILIGKVSWAGLENTDDLLTEYWRLRQLENEEKDFRAKLEDANVREKELKITLDNPEAAHIPELDLVADQLEESRSDLTSELQTLQDLLAESEKIRKLFNGLKLKLSVLKTEETAEELISETRGRMLELKAEFDIIASRVKDQRETVEAAETKIETLEARQNLLEARLSARTRDNTRKYSDVRRTIVELESKISILDSERSSIYLAIGRYLRNSENASKPGVKPLLGNVRPLVTRARELAKSIDYNRRLAGG